MLKNANEYAHHVRLIARLVRTLLASEHFDSLADLTDALKFRCAQLRIRWTNDDINAAYALIASNTPLPGRVLPRKTSHVEREPEGVIARDEAGAILNRLGIYL
jgi:hypothetical protein